MRSLTPSSLTASETPHAVLVAFLALPCLAVVVLVASCSSVTLSVKTLTGLCTPRPFSQHSHTRQ